MRDILISILTKPRSRNSRNFIYALAVGICVATLFAVAWILYCMFPVILIYLKDGSIDAMKNFFPDGVGVFEAMFHLTYYFAGGGFVSGFLYSLFMDAFWIPTFEKKTT